MAIGPGFVPAQLPTGQEYFKLPFNELLAGLSAKQERYDKGIAAAKAIPDLIPEAGLQTQDVRNQMISEIDTKLNPLMQKLQTTGEYNPYEIEQIASSLKKDPRLTWLKQDVAMMPEANKLMAEGQFNYGLQDWNKEGKIRQLRWDGSQMVDPITGKPVGSIGEAYKYIAPADIQSGFVKTFKESIIPTVTNVPIDQTKITPIYNTDGTLLTMRVTTIDGKKITDLSPETVKEKLTSKIGNTSLGEQIYKSLPGKDFGAYYFGSREKELGNTPDVNTFIDDFMGGIFGLTKKEEEIKDSSFNVNPSNSGKDGTSNKPLKIVPTTNYTVLTGTTYTDYDNNPITSVEQLNSFLQNSNNIIEQSKLNFEKQFNDSYADTGLKLEKVVNAQGIEVFELNPTEAINLSPEALQDRKDEVALFNTGVQAKEIIQERLKNVEAFYLAKYPELNENLPQIFSETLAKVKTNTDSNYKITREIEKEGERRWQNKLDQEKNILMSQGFTEKEAVDKVNNIYYNITNPTSPGGSKKFLKPEYKDDYDQIANPYYGEVAKDENFINQKWGEIAQQEIFKHPSFKNYKNDVDGYLKSLERENTDALSLIGLPAEQQAVVSANLLTFMRGGTSSISKIRFADAPGTLSDESNETLRKELETAFVDEKADASFMAKYNPNIRIDSTGETVVDLQYKDKSGKMHKLEINVNDISSGPEFGDIVNQLNPEFDILTKANFAKAFYTNINNYGKAALTNNATIYEVPSDIKLPGNINVSANSKVISFKGNSYVIPTFGLLTDMYKGLQFMTNQAEADLYLQSYLNNITTPVKGIDKFLEKNNSIKVPPIINFQ